jgi:hypothetical protein
MNVSCWIYPAVACISLSIGTSQADPEETSVSPRACLSWRERGGDRPGIVARPAQADIRPVSGGT